MAVRLALTLEGASLHLDPHADGARVLAEGNDANLVGEDGRVQNVLNHAVRVGVGRQDGAALVVDVAVELLHAFPPVLDGVGLGELLSVPVAEATLGQDGGDAMSPQQIHLQMLLDVGLDQGSWAPGSARRVHVEPRVVRSHGGRLVAGTGRYLRSVNSAIFQAEGVVASFCWRWEKEKNNNITGH